FQGKRPTIFEDVDGIFGFLLKRPSILRISAGHWLEKCCWAVNPAKTPSANQADLLNSCFVIHLNYLPLVEVAKPLAVGLRI
ncbi:MAG: hypothetical protein RR420_08305, partial [Anaerovoracaceae bacterium]